MFDLINKKQALPASIKKIIKNMTNRFPKFGNRFAKLQRLTRSSGIVLQNCKGLREVRESLCKIAEACAKFGNRFAKLQRLTRSSGIALQKTQRLREVRESLCVNSKACAKFGNRLEQTQRLARSSGIVLHLFYAFLVIIEDSWCCRNCHYGICSEMEGKEKKNKFSGIKIKPQTKWPTAAFISRNGN